ncbi:MAG: sugar transferase [Bilifractor sp.]
MNFRLQCLADFIALLLSFSISFFWRFKSPRIPIIGRGFYIPGAYANLLPAVVILYLMIAYFSLSRENYIHRSIGYEIASVTKTDVALVILMIVYFFFTRSSVLYSRAFIAFFGVLFWITDFLLRLLMRIVILPNRKKSAEQMIVIGDLETVKERLPVIDDPSDWRVHVCGIVITDQDMKGEYIDGTEVIANVSDMREVLQSAAADSVVLLPSKGQNIDAGSVSDMAPDLQTLKAGSGAAVASASAGAGSVAAPGSLGAKAGSGAAPGGYNIRELATFMHDCGKTVRVDFSQYEVIRDANFTLDRVGSCDVVTYSPVETPGIRYRIFKKIFDVVLSILLMPLLGIVWILSAIFLNIESKGPVIMSRVRVGKNGRRFNQYRFRVLRMDAEERIREGKNPKTVWGRFLSFSHLDRLPLILNVFLTDMSFVGPHAASLTRYLNYGSERRKNLCVTPGITGYWAFVKDENTIAHKERAYVTNWGYLKDIALLAEFLVRYISGTLPRKYDNGQIREEIRMIAIYEEEHEPLQYDHSFYQAPTGIGVSCYHFFKRLLDIVISLVAIIVLSPLFLVLMILVMGTDGGSPFYAHSRIGKNGRRIHVYKFRTMRTDAGDLKKLLTPKQLEQYQREFKIDNDPRITKIGNFLRRTSLDELPQLFNILGGSLSFVGPRPIVEEETHIYGKDIGKLLSVKPGLTGYWQAYARNNATYESGERQQMEMYYIEHASMGLDCKIVLKTFSSVAKETGAQ